MSPSEQPSSSNPSPAAPERPAAGAVRIIPLGGLGEIGMNTMLLETADDVICIDCGVMFPDDPGLGVDVIIPDLTALVDRRDRLRAYVLTHGHEDHVGALPYALKVAPAPVYGSPFTLAL